MAAGHAHAPQGRIRAHAGLARRTFASRGSAAGPRDSWTAGRPSCSCASRPRRRPARACRAARRSWLGPQPMAREPGIPCCLRGSANTLSLRIIRCVQGAMSSLSAKGLMLHEGDGKTVNPPPTLALDNITQAGRHIAASIKQCALLDCTSVRAGQCIDRGGCPHSNCLPQEGSGYIIHR